MKKLLFAIPVLAILVLVAAGCNSAVHVSTQANQPMSTPIPTPTTQIELTDGKLNTYSNLSTGLAFKYPSNWKVQDDEDPGVGVGAIKITGPNGLPYILITSGGRIHNNDLQAQLAAINCGSEAGIVVSCQNLKSENGVSYSRIIFNDPPSPGDNDYMLDAQVATGVDEILVVPQTAHPSISAVAHPIGSDAITTAVFDQVLSTLYVPSSLNTNH